MPSWLPSWALLLSLLPIATIALTLMGYGYDLAYLEAFGLSPSIVQHGPLDFLLRSVYALMSVFETRTDLKTQFSSIDGIHGIWQETEWMRYALSAFVITLILAAILAKELGQQQPFQSVWLQHTLTRAKKPSQLALEKYRFLPKQISMAWRLLIGGAAIGWLIPPVFVYMFSAVAWAGITLAITFVASVPLIGFSSGKSHAQLSVIDPMGCEQKSPQGVTTQAGASCVRILKDGKEQARGRLIEQSANRVWLLQKQPWNVIAIPTDGATVEYTTSEARP